MSWTTWTFTHQDWHDYCYCWVTNLPTTEIKTETQIWHHSLGWPASDLVVGWPHQTTSSLKRITLFVLSGVETYSGYRFAFPAFHVSIKTTIYGIIGCLIHCHGIPHNICFWPRTHFMAREVWQWAHDQSGNPLVIPCSQHLEAADLKERWNSILKTQLQCQLGGSSLEGWGRVLWKAVYALNQCPINFMVSPTIRIQGS